MHVVKELLIIIQCAILLKRVPNEQVLGLYY